MEHARVAPVMDRGRACASRPARPPLPRLPPPPVAPGRVSVGLNRLSQAAEGRLAKELTRLSARDHFFDAGICVLAKGDSVHARECLDRWCGMDYTFEDSREGRLFAKLIEVVEESK